MSKFTGTLLTDEMAQQVLSVAEALRAGSYSQRDMEPVIEVVCDMSDVVMRYFFQQPARDFGLSVSLRSIVDLSVASASKTVRFGLSRVLPKLNDAQRRQLGEFLLSTIHELGTVSPEA